MSTEDAREAIQRAVQLFTDAFKRGDSKAVASLYTLEAKLLPPNHPPVYGSRDIRRFWQEAMDAGAKEGNLQTLEVEVHGDTAYEVGRYKLVIEQGNGERVSDVGKYVVIWKRVDGEWNMAVDIFNSDLPAPGR